MNTIYIILPLNYPKQYKQEVLYPYQLLENYFHDTNQNFKLEFVNSNTNLRKISYLIISHPIRFFRQDNQKIHYTNISPIWHRWLLKNNPTATILLLGVTYPPEGMPNYINLLNLPSNFNTILNNAQRVNSFPFEKLEGDTYKDHWREKVSIYGKDAIDRTRLFIKGHERAEGENNLSKPLSDLNEKFNTLCSHLSDGRHDQQTTIDSFLNADPHHIWERLQKHWQHHQRDLELTPFFGAIKIIQEQMDNINTFMSGNTLDRESILQIRPNSYTEEIRKILREEIEIYIYNRDFFNILTHLP